MADQPTILVVDDDSSILTVLEARLASAGFQVAVAGTAEAALEVLASTPLDLVLSDVRLPGLDGRELLKRVQETWPGLPTVLLTAYGSIPEAVAAVKAGAADYLTKPFDGRELVAKLHDILARSPVRPRPTGQPPLSRLLWGGTSPAMARLYELIDRVAPSEASVLISGESGTGKELVARIIHQRSRRAAGPLVVVDCGATPANLLESELFGHVKGSFTHALRDKKGLIQEAHKGTLFLDEIGNIGPEMQTRLLRFLQDHAIRRVGEIKEISVDCRVLAATNADLAAMIKSGAFREDLYYRLKVISLTIPPLRQRKEDLPLLAERFVAQAAQAAGRPGLRIAPSTMDLLLAHDWPGNVRELKHVLEAGVVLCPGDLLRPADLQLEPPLTAKPAPEGPLSLDESERRAILQALERTGWVLTEAAQALGISRRSIHYKVKKYGLTPPGRRGLPQA